MKTSNRILKLDFRLSSEPPVGPSSPATFAWIPYGWLRVGANDLGQGRPKILQTSYLSICIRDVACPAEQGSAAIPYIRDTSCSTHWASGLHYQRWWDHNYKKNGKKKEKPTGSIFKVIVNGEKLLHGTCVVAGNFTGSAQRWCSINYVWGKYT